MPNSHREDSKRYIRFDDRDEAILARTFAVARPLLPGVVELFYARLMAQPDAAAVFRDDAQVERQKTALLGWLERLFTDRRDDGYFARLAKIGDVHVRVRVPLRYVVLGMSVLRTELEALLHTVEVEDRLALVAALHRALDLDLAVLVESYGIAELRRAREADQRETSQRKSRLASAGILAGGLAHEIRNPLNGAQLHLTFLRRQLEQSGVDAATIEAADIASKDIQRLAGFVTELLAFANPRALQLGRADVRDVCRAVVAATEAEARSHGIELRAELGPAPLEAAVDAERLAHALESVMKNALESIAASRRGGRVVLRAGALGDHVVVEVEDDGLGIADAEAPVFDPFFTTKAHGSGLGLSIAHRIITDHAGTITFASAHGRTTFTITLPGLGPA